MTETREPVAVGEVADEVVGTLYHGQMLKEYWQAGEQITLNAMVMLCLAARRFDERVKFVLLDDSDQGDWQYVAGLASALPAHPGDFAEDFNLDPECVFDDEGWASSVDDRTAHVWQPFVQSAEPMSQWLFLDVDKVLAEVDLPWRPAPAAHGPVPATWFGRGLRPTCKCGFAPQDNEALTQHWLGFGFVIVDDHGTLVRRSVTPVTEGSPVDEPDGAPAERWEVTEPSSVYATDEEPTAADLAREMGA